MAVSDTRLKCSDELCLWHVWLYSLQCLVLLLVLGLEPDVRLHLRIDHE
jgi:hypothetical protein